MENKMGPNSFIIDGHKLYWHLDRVADWQKNNIIAPIYIEISPVSFCNHKCTFCGLDFAHTERLTLDADILMKRISEMACLGVKSIMFAGEGEPLLHPRITEVVTHTKNCGIDVAITTNGMGGNPEMWEKLLPALTWIRFSIDASTPEVYSIVHGVPPTAFERTVNNLVSAVTVKQKLNLPVTVGVQFLMIKQNLVDIDAALRLYSNIGVDYLSLKPYSEHPQMLNKSGFNYSVEMIDKIAEHVQEFVQSSSGKTAIFFRKAATEAYRSGSQKFKVCHALPFWGYISSSADFHTCSVYLNDSRFMAGSIYTETMEKIFFGQKRCQSIAFASEELLIGQECRINCRMARINEFLCFLSEKPSHVNFI